MRILKCFKCFVFTLALTSLLTLAASAQTSLYERLGGKESITAVVDEFAGRVLADTRINAKFAKSDPTRLKAMLVEQLCEATGGPCKYTGRSMPAAHLNMGVTTGEFNALVEDLVGALDKFNVAQAEKDELLGALAPMKSAIVETESSATGTPLPKKYKPWTAGKGGKAKGGKGKKNKAADSSPAEAAPAEAAPAEMTKPAKGSKKVKEEKPAEEEKEMSGKKSKKKN